MKKRKKKNIARINGIIAVLFIAPLIVFAAIYFSNQRKNRFLPCIVDIEVNEGNQTSGMIEDDSFIWTKRAETPNDNDESNNIYYTDKPVKIKDIRKFHGEALRVTFIPMWYDIDENKEVTDVYSKVFNFNNITLLGNNLVYRDHDPADGNDASNDKVITLKMKSDWNTSGWRYSDLNDDPSGDGCFYYTGELDNSQLTAQLLDSVELNSNAYGLTENYMFRLDVLADAIQISADAATTREW